MTLRQLPWILAAAVAMACATNPATGKRQLVLLSEADEIALGREADVSIRREMGVYDSPGLQSTVSRVGQALAKSSHRTHLPWTFAVVDENAVNAFALPGGFIYVTRGILPYLRDEAELAAVLAHEVGHVDARHSVDQYSRQMLTQAALAGGSAFLPQWGVAFAGLGAAADLLFLRYGRTAELESDRLGVGYASANGWAPQAMRGVLGTLGRLDEFGGSHRGVPNWALSHPPATDRIARVEEAIAAASGSSAGRTNEAQYEALLDGLVVGDSREDGMLRGTEFLHPILRFAVRFPDAWTISNTASQVSARAADPANAAISLTLSKSTAPSPEEASRRDLEKSGLRLASGSNVRINGLDAFDAVYEGALDNVPVAVRVAHIRSGGQTYMLAGLTTVQEFGQADQRLQATVRSFRALSQNEADQLRPNRLRFETVRPGDTWESLARRATAFGAPKPAALAIMNGHDPATPPRPGSRVRVVVGG